MAPKSVKFQEQQTTYSVKKRQGRFAFTKIMGDPSGFPELVPIEVELGIVTVFGILMPIIGYELYRWAESNARRKGSLSEY